MLSYAFQTLNDKAYKKIETENFENTAELFSEILIIGVSAQIKQGLVRDYIDVTERCFKLSSCVDSSVSTS